MSLDNVCLKTAVFSAFFHYGGLTKASLTVHPNVYATGAEQANDAANQLSPSRRALLPRDGAPKIGYIGHVLGERVVRLKRRERRDFQGALGPSHTERTKRPRIDRGGSDTPIRVNIGLGRGGVIGPSGAQAWLLSDALALAAEELSGVHFFTCFIFLE